MARRIFSAVVGLSIVYLAFTEPYFAWLAVLASILIALFCTFEMMAMMRRKGLRVFRRVASIGVVAMMIEAMVSGMQYSIYVFGIAVCVAWILRLRGRVQGAWGDVSATCFTLAYIGIPMSVIVKLFLAGTQAQAWLLMMLAVIWTTDSFALIVGKMMGRHKMWPKISPGKTWEGSLGGIMGALGVIVVVRAYFSPYFPGLGNIELIIFAVLFSSTCQLGDLVESLIKRDVGVKDSGSELTGHGGFLDLMDAVLFCAVPLIIYLELIHPGVL